MFEHLKMTYPAFALSDSFVLLMFCTSMVVSVNSHRSCQIYTTHTMGFLHLACWKNPDWNNFVLNSVLLTSSPSEFEFRQSNGFSIILDKITTICWGLGFLALKLLHLETRTDALQLQCRQPFFPTLFIHIEFGFFRSSILPNKSDLFLYPSPLYDALNITPNSEPL